MAQQKSNGGQEWAGIVAHAWADANFKKRLLGDPAAVPKEQGVTVPAGVRVKVLEDTADVVHLTLPGKPTGELSDEQLARTAGGILIGLLAKWRVE